jgi:thymidylate synthase (FAD)
MKLIKPSFEIIEQTPGIQGIKKQIELAGRTCYKSEDKITDTSCEEFVNRMINSGHGAMLEHGTVYLMLPGGILSQIENLPQKYKNNPYCKCTQVMGECFTFGYAVTTNYRVLVENGWLDDLQYQCEPTKHHEKRITVKFICDRGVSHEFVRHRTMSFAQESTRYCNYSKDKFGNELTCILPSWEIDGSYLEFEEDLKVIESIYFKWLNKGWKAQEARYFLPTGVKTELVVTGFVSDWEHFLKLRCHSTAHPQARELAIPLQEEFIKKGYING